MKHINGTVTLSFLEEDNQQRVIFRVVPLCTREGQVFRNKTTDFPDQGSLRIVPDKREQSTFKERMRAMGSLCAIHLCNEGKELAKVRQNRNYDPGQGECNQFAIYSDVICEFAESGIFEIFAEGEDCAHALSPRVLLRRGKVLYGPMERGETPDWAALRPFGNDSYLLHTVELADGAEHTFYWDPEQTLSWRQRRGFLRRGRLRPGEADEGAADAINDTDEEPRAEAAPVARVADKPAPQPKPQPEARPVPERSQPVQPPVRTPVEPIATQRAAAPETRPEPPAEPIRRQPKPERRREQEPDAALPIGSRLAILDQTITFEEQISKLDQPLSTEANLLSHAGPRAVAEPEAAPVRFNGTPLVRAGVRAPQPIRHGEPLHYVVERQIRSARREHADQRSDFHHVDNPIENLHVALEKAWETPETRRQAMQALSENEAFMQCFLQHMYQQGRELKVIRAAQEQLEDIEAERLSLLIQLENAKNDYKRATEAMHAGLTQKKREELRQLDNQLTALREERDRLNATIAVLGDQAQGSTLEWLAQNNLHLCACNGDTVALSPTLGVTRTPGEMVAAVRVAMNRQGFACNEDDATELLLHFALNDELCLCGDSLHEAELCACTLLDSLGLMGVTARTDGTTRLEVANLLPDNGLRTPTVEVCPLGRAALNPFGHKTIRLLETRSPMREMLPLPVVYAPSFRPALRETRQGETAVRPTSLESFGMLREEAKPLMAQGEAWFSRLENKLSEQSSELAGITTQRMRVFVSAASGKLRGGFLAAADAAMLGWVIPEVYKQVLNPEPLREEMECLPRCLAALGIQ